jgi:hypothetical protein
MVTICVICRGIHHPSSRTIKRISSQTTYFWNRTSIKENGVINLLLTSVVVDTNESVSTTHLLSVESHRARRAVGRRRGTKIGVDV